MNRLGIALIGYGGIGRVHTMAYRAIPYHYGLPAGTIKIVGVSTAHPDTAAQAAQEIGCEVWSADYRDLLARDDVDVVDCCVPNFRHEEIVVAAAQAGKHVYCEKPLAMDVAQGQRMVASASEAGIGTQMTFNFRFFPAITRARQLVDEGFLGRVFSFHGRYFRSSYIDPDKPLSWRLRREMAGGGALFDLGSHVLDLVHYLLGDFDSVQASLETLIKSRPIAAGSGEMGPVDVDDLAVMHIRMAGGALGLVEASRMGTGVTNDLRIELFGDRGAIRFNLAQPSWLEVYDVRDTGQPLGGMRGFRRLETVQRHEGQRAPDWSMAPGFVRSHAECQYQFLKAISEGREPAPNLEAGLRVQELMEAAARSAEEDRWVMVKEVAG
jgi:predicted dehydrogenase